MSQVKLTIDDKEVTVEVGTTVLEAAKTVGIMIPHYCYHPGLPIDGNCRMCLVEVEKMPKPVIACHIRVAEGMVVKTTTENIQSIRRRVLELLLINHPLDCPTCDQAGECRLQDYYMEYDVAPSRFQEKKNRKNKSVDLGAHVMLDQERCIACTRCVRFCKDIVGDAELCLSYRGDHVKITTFPGKKLSNRYAGNVVDVCPVGALTNKDFRFKKRVWFLKTTPSVCPGCSRGCNIEIDHEESKVYRLRPRHNREINKYWMCDEGRYGYYFVNENRILRPQVLSDGGMHEASSLDAIQKISQIFSSHPLNEIAVVGHAGETKESLEALKRFSQEVLQTKQLYSSCYNPSNPYSDNFLMTADKNPNRAEVNNLGFKPLKEIKKAKGLIVLNSLSDEDLEVVKEKKIPVLALLASNVSEVMPLASVVFPTPTFAEQEGHFTNIDGKTQKISKAFEIRGEGKLIKDWLNDLAEVIQREVRRAS